MIALPVLTVQVHPGRMRALIALGRLLRLLAIIRTMSPDAALDAYRRAAYRWFRWRINGGEWQRL